MPKINSGQLTRNGFFLAKMTRNVSPKWHSVYFLSLETTLCVCFADQNYFSKLRKGHSGSLEVYGILLGKFFLPAARLVLAFFGFLILWPPLTLSIFILQIWFFAWTLLSGIYRWVLRSKMWNKIYFFKSSRVQPVCYIVFNTFNWKKKKLGRV